MPKEKGKRIFLVCRSKNCEEAKRSGVHCTISRMYVASDVLESNYGDYLNRRRVCVLYSTPAIINTVNTPDWRVSPDKPGRRKLIERERVEEQKFYTDNPDFLEM
jgi:hypothetical protein